MNETSKKSKVDKCPSKNIHDRSVIDVQRNCILNEIVPDKIELSNGLVNGITTDLTVKKHGRKSKKNRNVSADINRESIINDKEASKSKSPELKNNDDHSEEFLHHNNVNIIEESCSKNNVNNVNTLTIKGTKKKKCKVGQIVSSVISNNQECDNALSDSRIAELGLKNDLCEKELNKIVQDVNLASSSNKSVHEDSTDLISSNNKNEKNDVTDIADSLKKIELNSDNIVDSPISIPKIDFIQYENELQMPMIMKIIQKDLSEPYSIYTYRYFIHNWPKLCFLVSISFLYH